MRVMIATISVAFGCTVWVSASQPVSGVSWAFPSLVHHAPQEVSDDPVVAPSSRQTNRVIQLENYIEQHNGLRSALVAGEENSSAVVRPASTAPVSANLIRTEKSSSTINAVTGKQRQARPVVATAKRPAFNPSDFRPGVTWVPSKSTHFDIYTQKRSSGISSSNMAMTFENAYQTLRRFIPWMMSGRVRVFVYQDREAYQRHEPNARGWSRAMAYPTRGEIVVYDEPGRTQELREVFTHELTHIFTQQFFDSQQTGELMTPLWLDEGLAVFMEDQAAGMQGGVWSEDLRTLNFQRGRRQKRSGLGSKAFNGSFGKSHRSGMGRESRHRARKKETPVSLVPFARFMQENSLRAAEEKKRVQEWYFQAFAMVRFLLNPSGGMSPSNRMQFEQFTRLVAQGEKRRDPSTGFLVKDANGKIVYDRYNVEQALGRAYRYGSVSNFEDRFWDWINQ